MRLAALVTGLALASPALAAERDLPRPLLTTWHVSLDAAGHVKGLAAAGKVAPLLEAPLQQQIRQWQFIPGTRDGVAMATETTLRVGLAFTRGSHDEIQVSITHAVTGGNADPGREGVPQYPRQSLQRSEQGLAAVKVSYDADGHIVDARLHEDAPQIPRALAASAISAVKRWQVTPERVGGVGIPGELIVPLCFSVSSASRKLDCQLHLPGLDNPAQDNQAVALNSITGLVASVTGTLL